jgi:xylulokinase
MVVGGGTKSAIWLSILVDVLGKEAVLPRYCDAAYGAALMAGEGVGYWKTSELLSQGKDESQVIRPNLAHTQYYDSQFPIFRELAEAFL